MRTGNLKKYIIPNIPYLFIGWAFLKLGTAYRLAAGADFLSKVMGSARPSAWPLLTLRRGSIRWIGWWASWGPWRFGCSST